MASDEIVTLRQAAALCGRSRKDLQALIERGALPALRRDGHWLVTVADLALLFPATPQPSAPPEAVPVRVATIPPVVPKVVPQPLAAPSTTPVPAPPPAGPPEDHARTAQEPGRTEGPASLPSGPPGDGGTTQPPGPEVALLLNLLRQRDEQVTALQEERARLSGQIGFLQGLLVEREARMHLLETAPAPRDTAIELRAGGAATAPNPQIPAAGPVASGTVAAAAVPEADSRAAPAGPGSDHLPGAPTTPAATNGTTPRSATPGVAAGTPGRRDRLGTLLRLAVQRAGGSLKRR